MSFILSLVLAVLVLVGSYYNGSISFGHAEIHNPLITYPCALAGVAMILLMSMLLAGTKACKNDTKWMYGLKWFGRNSFTAMVIHNPIKGIVCVIIGSIFGCGSDFVSNNDSFSILAFAITFILTVMGIIIINVVKDFYNKY